MPIAISRLRLARKVNGLTQKALADALDVSPSTIAAYENGNTSPGDRISQIAAVLGFPVTFFFREELTEVPSTAISFRARRSMSQAIEDRAIARSTLGAHILAQFITERFVLPEFAIPDLSHLAPEEAAIALRHLWSLGHGPIHNLVHLLEAKGVLVFFLYEDSKSVDGFNYMIGNRPFVFLNTFKGSGERGRFDAAHELGHLVLHQNVMHDRIDSQQVEMQANEFASAFLLPREQFRLEAPRSQAIPAFLALKPRWGVSVQAMVRRCRDIGLLTQWHYESAFKQFSKLGWRSGAEDGALPREESHLHFVMFNILSDVEIYPDDIAKSLDIDVPWIEELMPAARYFRRQSVRKIDFLKILSSE